MPPCLVAKTASSAADVMFQFYLLYMTVMCILLHKWYLYPIILPVCVFYYITSICI